MLKSLSVNSNEMFVVRYVCAALLLASALTGCKSNKNSSSGKTAVIAADASSPVAKDSLLISLRRGACFGACPQFTATVYKSGFAEYSGEKNVKKLGVWITTLSKEQLGDLTTLIRQYKLEEMDTAYINQYLADYPSYLLVVCDKKPRKQILVNHEKPPVEISEFTKLYERIIDELNWQLIQGKARRDEE